MKLFTRKPMLKCPKKALTTYYKYPCLLTTYNISKSEKFTPLTCNTEITVQVKWLPLNTGVRMDTKPHLRQQICVLKFIL